MIEIQIGSEELADFISQWASVAIRENYPSDISNYPPDGWNYLGSGSYRHVYLGPDGFVYKVQHYSSDRFWAENRMEWENYKLYAAKILTESNGRAMLAPCEFYQKQNVIAMQFCPKVNDAMEINHMKVSYSSPEVKKLVRLFYDHGLSDVHWDNVHITTGDVLVMFDYTH